MATSSKGHSRLVLSADGSDDAGRAEAGFKASAAVIPLMLGIAAPALLIMLLDPQVILRRPFLVSLILIPLLLIAVAIFIWGLGLPYELFAFDFGR